MKITVLVECDYDEIEKIICNHYGINEFNCAYTEEWSNDSTHKFNIKKEPLSQWDAKKIELIRAGQEPSFCLHAVLTDLCNSDIIEPGQYLINVSW